MKVIIGGRGSGKSAEAIKESVRTGAHIVVMSKQQEKLIKGFAKELGYEDLPEVIVLSENNAGSESIRGEAILENADAYLRNMFGLNIKAVTMSSDNIVTLVDDGRENKSLIEKNIILNYQYERAVEYLEQNEPTGECEPKLSTIIIKDLVNMVKNKEFPTGR